jgi:Aerotolerance regulator N-terminal
MTFLNAAILFGAGLAAIPVIIHLLLRNKPKKLLFPALRLLMLRKQVNSRRMRLKHFWLLLLRILLIVLVVLALSRPTLPAAEYRLTKGDWFKLAIIGLAAVVAWFGVQRLWGKKDLPAPTRRYRRTLLGSGIGVGALLLFLLLFLWPYGNRIVAQWKDPQSPVQENYPISAVMIFDVSPSMSYRQDNETRLDVARRLSQELTARLPSGSQVSVTHNATEDPPVFLGETLAVRDRVELLDIHDQTSPLDRRVRAAIELQRRDRERTLEQTGGSSEIESTDRYLREIYLFTDLARHAWQASAFRSLREQMEANPWLAVYVVDVSTLAPRNVTLGLPRLSSRSLSQGEPLAVRLDVIPAGGASGPQTVELFVKNLQGEFAKQGTQSIALDSGEGVMAEFAVPAQNPGYLEGKLRLVSSDPLLFDNERFFTAQVSKPPRVLVVSDERSWADLWMARLELKELRKSGKILYSPEWQPSSALDRVELDQFDMVCLLSVEAPTERAWSRLEEFVTNGGGLLVSLGKKRISLDAYRTGASVKSLLPGFPLTALPFNPPEFLDFFRKEHPLAAGLEPYGGPGQLLTAPVFYRWKVDLADEGHTVIRYTDANLTPALIERSVGRGRVLMLTTALYSETQDWNELPLARVEYFIFTDLLLKYLNTLQDRPLNLQVGDSVRIPLPPGNDLTEYLLTSPGLEQETGPVAPGATSLTFGPLKQAGAYLVRSPQSVFRAAFSANIPESESDLSILSDLELQEMFGEGRYDVARSLEELEPVIRSRRLGVEIVPLLLLLAAILFMVEQVVANRFYADDSATANSPTLSPATSPKAA